MVESLIIVEGTGEPHVEMDGVTWRGAVQTKEGTKYLMAGMKAVEAAEQRLEIKLRNLEQKTAADFLNHELMKMFKEGWVPEQI